MGDLAGGIGRSISGLIEGLIRTAQDAVQGVFGALTGVVPLPLVLVGGVAILLAVAWFLAKR